MRDYELVLLVSPDVGDEGFPATVERVTKFITDRGGQIKNVDQWGRRRLAYTVRKFNDGFYVLLTVIAPGSSTEKEVTVVLAERPNGQ